MIWVKLTLGGKRQHENKHTTQSSDHFSITHNSLPSSSPQIPHANFNLVSHMLDDLESITSNSIETIDLDFNYSLNQLSTFNNSQLHLDNEENVEIPQEKQDIKQLEEECENDNTLEDLEDGLQCKLCITKDDINKYNNDNFQLNGLDCLYDEGNKGQNQSDLLIDENHNQKEKQNCMLQCPFEDIEVKKKQLSDEMLFISKQAQQQNYYYQISQENQQSNNNNNCSFSDRKVLGTQSSPTKRWWLSRGNSRQREDQQVKYENHNNKLNIKNRNVNSRPLLGFFSSVFFSRSRVTYDSSFISACSEKPQDLRCYRDCEDFLMSMPGSAQAISTIFEQLNKQIDIISNDFEQLWIEKGEGDIKVEEVMWKSQQRLYEIVLAGFKQVVVQWPQNIPLSEDHCIAIQKSLQNVIFNKVQLQILGLLQCVNQQQDKIIWRFCNEVAEVLPQQYETVGDGTWTSIVENEEDGDRGCKEEWNDKDSYSQLSMVVEYDLKHMGSEFECIRHGWEVDSSSHDYCLTDCECEVPYVDNIERSASEELHNPFELVIQWLLANHLGTLNFDLATHEDDCPNVVSYPLDNLTVSWSTGGSLSDNELIEEQDECPLNESLNYFLPNLDQSESVQFNREALLCVQDDLDVSSDLHEKDFKSALGHLQGMTQATCPIDMTFQISEAHDSIRSVLALVGIGGGYVGQVPADEVLPVFINLVVHARFQHLATLVQYLDFSNLIGDHLTSQAQMVCDLQMAMSYIVMKMNEVRSCDRYKCLTQNMEKSRQECQRERINCVELSCSSQGWNYGQGQVNEMDLDMHKQCLQHLQDAYFNYPNTNTKFESCSMGYQEEQTRFAMNLVREV